MLEPCCLIKNCLALIIHLSCTDPYEDQFEKKDKARKEGIAKNEYQRLKNMKKSLKGGRVKGGSVVISVSPW